MSVSVSGTTVTFPDSSTITSGWTGFKNRIINGAMVIDQRNAGASVTINNPSAIQYVTDRWGGYGSVASKFTLQQNAGSVTPPNGYKYYLGATSSSAYSIGVNDNFQIMQYVEGYNMADFGWGTASAQTVTLSFWVYSSLTGTFGGALHNYNSSRSYPFSYTISSANTWTQVSITVTGDTGGTWYSNNLAGVAVVFSLGQGSNYSGTAGSWTASDKRSVTGAVSVVGTNGATFYITGVQLEKGSTASSFEYRDYGTELVRCQRYFTRFGGVAGYTAFGSGMWRNTTTPNIIMGLPVTMRTTPSCTISSPSNFFVSSGSSNVTPSAINLDQGSPTSLMIDATYSSGTTGQATRMFGANSTSATIDVSAEL